MEQGLATWRESDGHNLENDYHATLISRLEELRLRMEPRLVKARSRERAAPRGLRGFKDANGPDREPRQPESLSLHYVRLGSSS